MTAVLDRPSGGSTNPPPPGAMDRSRHARPEVLGAASPRWAPFALAGLLVSAAVLYLWKLADSGFGNTFYTAAAWAGSKSWSAWFFGALDPSDFITVDKPPAALWVTGLSVRVFGLNSWAVLAPQAVMGVASVALVYAAVRRAIPDPRQGVAGGLIAGAVLTFTPAAALMFRFNNPDALLVLLMATAAYCLTRAVATSSGRWLALVGVALGFAFLTKMLQGLLILPGFGLVYLLFAQNSIRRRIVQIVGATIALIVSAGWFVVVTLLVPSSARPYIGGSTNNTLMDLVLGYNGLGRINGGAGNMGGGGGGQPGGSFGGATGFTRLFGSEMGNEISWLFPVALLAIVFALYVALRSFMWPTYRDGITRSEFAGVALWGSWLITTALVFSFMTGTMHPYYTVALAPAIAGLVGIGSVMVWRRRAHIDGRIGLSMMIGMSIAWSITLLARNDFGPSWIRWALGVTGGVAIAAIIVGGALNLRKLLSAAIITGAIAGFVGTASFSIATANTAHTGSIPTAVRTSGEGGSMGGPGGGGMGAPGGSRPSTAQAGLAQTGLAQTGLAQTSGSSAQRGGTGPGMTGMGENNSDLVALLQGSNAQWSAAVNGSQSASGLEIFSGTSLMAIGGWSGDPAPTLSRFIAYAKARKIGYYVSSGSGGGPGGRSGTASQIQQWVAAHYTATTVGGSTVYKLS